MFHFKKLVVVAYKIPKSLYTVLFRYLRKYKRLVHDIVPSNVPNLV